MDLHFHGHACVELAEGDARVLIDPFLKPNNPAAVTTADEVDPTHILITHAHADHVADAVPLAKRTGAHCVAIVEIATWLDANGAAEVSDPNLGGTVEFDWGWVKLVRADHTSTIPGSEEAPFSAEHGTVIGAAGGLLVNIGGKTVYHLGDTALFSDLELIAKRNPVDVALIPIGGHYTMDRHDAVVAAEMIGAETVIPIHYDTFPPIQTDPDAYRADVESQTSSKVTVLKPGESTSL